MSDMQDQYVAVPPLLVSTTGLESYLATLSRQLQRDMGEVKAELATSQREMTMAFVRINAIKRALSEKVLQEMQTLANSGTEDIDQAMSTAESELDEVFVRQNSEEPVDLFNGMLVLAKHLMQQNHLLKRALKQSVDAAHELSQLQREVRTQVAETRARMEQYHNDFREMARWFGTYDEDTKTTVHLTSPTQAAVEGNAGDVAGVAASSQHQRSPAQGASVYGMPTIIDDPLALGAPVTLDVEAHLTRSPLLLAFRRILLRDLGDRVAHTTELQAKEVGGVVSTLKEDIAQRVTPERVVSIVNNVQSDGARDMIRRYGERLKEIEANYVRREEYLSTMGTKADTLLLPVKADSATVSALERRLVQRYTDLEERVAYFEAEREEMRRIVRLLLANKTDGALPVDTALPHASAEAGGGGGALVQQSPQPSGKALMSLTRCSSAIRRRTTSPPTMTTTTSASLSQKTQRAHPTSLGPRTARSLPSTTLINDEAHDAEGAQLYRVVGVGRSGFASAQPQQQASSSPAVAPVSASPPPTLLKELLQRQTRGGAGGEGTAQEPAMTRAPQSWGKEAVAMTSGQVPYARYVTRELNRDRVEALPPLPYERQCK